MKRLEAVLWTGRNLEEVIEFTGKSRKFNDWFKSWEEYEKYVHEHGDVVKLFAPDGLSVDVLPGTWIVKTPEGFNVPMTNPWLKANKPEPQGLDEAAYLALKEISQGFGPLHGEGDMIDMFKAGTEWMTEQGETFETTISNVGMLQLPKLNIQAGDEVIVQIRKK